MNNEHTLIKTSVLKELRRYTVAFTESEKFERWCNIGNACEERGRVNKALAESYSAIEQGDVLEQAKKALQGVLPFLPSLDALPRLTVTEIGEATKAVHSALESLNKV